MPVARSLVAVIMVLAAAPALGMGVKPSCLDQLTIHTRAWAECTHRFSRQDRACKPSTYNMSRSMQLCERKGYSKKQIDAAMAKGAQTAGRPIKKKPVEIAPQPALPHADPSPIPKVDAPRPRND